MLKILVLLASLFLISCSGSEPASSSGGGGGGGGGGSTTSPKLSLVVKRRFESGIGETTNKNSYSTIGTCEVDNTAILGFDLPCSIQVEELILRYSELEFNVSTGSASHCSQVLFLPYSYRKSNSPTYLPLGATTDVDCTDLSLKECYGGAAKALKVNGQDMGFPEITGLYFIPGSSLSAKYTLDSPNKRYVTEGDADTVGNTSVANNLPSGSRGANIFNSNARYLANSYRDYQVLCLDQWGELNYSITFTLGDDNTLNTSGGAADTFYDWGF